MMNQSQISHKPRQSRLRNRTHTLPTQLVSQRVQRVEQIFPPVLRVLKMRTNVVSSTLSNTGEQDNWKGNSFFQAGPQFQSTGSFSANVPAGLSYLLSSNAITGASAPYSTATILASRFTLRILTDASNNAVGLRAVLWPSRISSVAGVPFALAAEQPYAQAVDISPNQTAGPITLSNTMSTSVQFSVDKSVLSLPSFTCSPSADPTYTWYWHYYVTPTDGSSTVSYTLETFIEYDVEFRQRNVYNSNVPS
jgi:hypothetical protein